MEIGEITYRKLHTQLPLRLLSIVLGSYWSKRNVNYPGLGRPAEHTLEKHQNR